MLGAAIAVAKSIKIKTSCNFFFFFLDDKQMNDR